MPVALVRPTSNVTLEEIALHNLKGEKGEQELARLAEGEVKTAFDLRHGPLIRATLVHLSDGEQVFVLTAHRIICDRASLQILLREVYSICAGATMPQVPRQARLQYHEVADHVPKEKDLSFWTQYLQGVPSSIDLPADRQRPASQTFRAARQKMSIEEELLRRLRAFAQTNGTDLRTVLVGAFAVLLARYTLQEDFVIGTRVSGRQLPELRDVIGPLEKMLPLRIDASGEPSFAEFVRRVHTSSQSASSHQDVSFETLLKQLRLDRDMSRHPLFQVLVGWEEADGTLLADGVTFLEVDSAAEQFDIALELRPKANQIEAALSYSVDVFDESTISRLLGHFNVLLRAAVEDSTASISRMPWLSEQERHQVLFEFNNTGFPYRKDVPLHKFIEEQVERTPQETALVFGSKRITYRDLNNRANQLARRLQKEQVRPDVLVGLCVERSLELIIAVLAILKAGGAYVPLDPEYPKDRIAAILQDSKARLLLTTEKSAGVLPPHTAQLIRLDADWPDIATELTSNPMSDVAANNLAYVLFTSGSTGRPKGVALEHRSASIFVQWARDVFSWNEIRGTLFSTSVCFDLSVFEMFVPLSWGGKVIIAQNALELPRLPAASEVTLVNTVPSAIAELVRSASVPSSVRVVNLAGEALLTSLAQQIYEQTSVEKVYNLYGPTEDTTYSTYTLVPRGGEVTIGQPLPHTQAYILDTAQQPVPIGVPGELYLAGDGLARGYFAREDLTSERFVPNPFSAEPGSRMYRTGDLARYLPDGNLKYMGRIDNQVKLRGFRIELEEIEAVLLRHSSVRSAVVVVKELAPGDKRLVAYIVPAGQSVSTSVLKDAVLRCLPAYMLPSAFVELGELPLSPNGKIDRRRLPAPEGTSNERAEVLGPRDELESMIVQIWQSALNVPAIGVHDDFFDLGGHSLIAARVLAEIGGKIGRYLPLSALFRAATVESLADLLRQQEDTCVPVVMEIQAGDGSRPPFFAIVPPGEESIGYAMLARHMGPEQTVYKIQGHAPVLDGSRPHTSEELKALTREYVAAIRSVLPHGPYCLGGLCDGTHIAEQVVLQLESEGEEVALFAIFDTWVMQHSQNRWLWKIDYYRQRLQTMKKMSLAEQLASYLRVAENKILAARGQKPARTDWQQRYWPENFTPPRFRAPVVLFKRPKQQFYYINDPEMGWGKRSESGVEIHEIDFHHLEILREPHVRQFGETLSRWMERLSLPSRTPVASSGFRTSNVASANQVQQGS